MPLDQPTLQQGDTGDAVTRLQQDLATVGYFTDTVDGVFGQATAAAVTQFQDDNGLTADGVVTPQVWLALEGPVPTVENSFDLAEFPSLGRVFRHASDQDANGYLAELGIEPI
jgi:peptidoglycan hydrolase-like protein with peptidoglycan-binding domain